jgi:hypothetical protein
MVIPAGFTFVDVLQKSRFQAAAQSFLDNELQGIDNADYLRQTARIEFDDTQPKVIINTFGMAPLEPAVERLLKERIVSYESLESTELIINQLKSETNRFDQQRYLIELRKRDSLELMRQQAEIEALHTRIGELNNRSTQDISFDQIIKELKVISPFVRKVRYAQTYISDLDEIDTVAVFRMQWDSSLDSLAIVSEEERLRNWLRIQLPNRSFIIEND